MALETIGCVFGDGRGSAVLRQEGAAMAGAGPEPEGLGSGVGHQDASSIVDGGATVQELTDLDLAAGVGSSARSARDLHGSRWCGSGAGSETMLVLFPAGG